jgi:hypothetical protein
VITSSAVVVMLSSTTSSRSSTNAAGVGSESECSDSSKSDMVRAISWAAKDSEEEEEREREIGASSKLGNEEPEEVGRGPWSLQNMSMPSSTSSELIQVVKRVGNDVWTIYQAGHRAWYECDATTNYADSDPCVLD